MREATRRFEDDIRRSRNDYNDIVKILNADDNGDFASVVLMRTRREQLEKQYGRLTDELLAELEGKITTWERMLTLCKQKLGERERQLFGQPAWEDRSRELPVESKLYKIEKVESLDDFYLL